MCRSQFEACLEQAGVEENLESCLVFGPNTFADLRRLALDDDQPAAGQQGYPALQRFCQASHAVFCAVLVSRLCSWGRC